MKITYATSYTLADTGASVYFAEGDAGNERQVQQEPLLRAAFSTRRAFVAEVERRVAELSPAPPAGRLHLR